MYFVRPFLFDDVFSLPIYGTKCQSNDWHISHIEWMFGRWANRCAYVCEHIALRMFAHQYYQLRSTLSARFIAQMTRHYHSKEKHKNYHLLQHATVTHARFTLFSFDEIQYVFLSVFIIILKQTFCVHIDAISECRLKLSNVHQLDDCLIFVIWWFEPTYFRIVNQEIIGNG